MNEDNNNPEMNGAGDMNNMQNDFGTLPGLEPNGMNGNDGFILPGMDQENMQNSMNSDPSMGGMPGMDGQQNPMDPMMGNQMG